MICSNAVLITERVPWNSHNICTIAWKYCELSHCSWLSQVKTFLQQFLAGLDVGPDAVHVAAVRFSDQHRINTWFPLNLYNTTVDLLNYLNAKFDKTIPVSGTLQQFKQRVFVYATNRFIWSTSNHDLMSQDINRFVVLNKNVRFTRCHIYHTILCWRIHITLAITKLWWQTGGLT